MVDVATVMPPMDLKTTILKPQFCHYACHHQGFLEPETAIYERESGAGEDILINLIENLRTHQLVNHKVDMPLTIHSLLSILH